MHRKTKYIWYPITNYVHEEDWLNSSLKYLWLLIKRPSLLSSRNLAGIKKEYNVFRYFHNKQGVIIGGSLRDQFRIFQNSAKKVINVDNSKFNQGVPTKADYIIEADNLYFAEDHSLDFVCSSHVLEHIANPLKAMTEWKRVLKKGSIIYTGIPDKRYTFDHKRKKTPLSHLIEDYKKNIDQTDTTHLSDFVENWDEEKDHSHTRQQFLENVKNNPTSQVHHHVWIIDDIKEIFEYMNLKVCYGPFLYRDTIHIVGVKQD